jgi:hypothetical protein
MKDNEQQLPPEIPDNLVPNEFKENKWKQEDLPIPPTRSIKLKGDELRASVRSGQPMDWVDIHERFVDLWQEARMCIWRAKHSKAGLKTFDPVIGKSVQSFIADEKMVLSAIHTTREVLDSIVKLRKGMGSEAGGIPHWAIERIERALQGHPDALKQLMRELAATEEKPAETD